jgi:cysteine sulfinate desulfinase/cysteine desulfurase-like protein
MGITPAKIMGSVRFSVGEFNSEEDINFTIKTTVDVLKELNG